MQIVIKPDGSGSCIYTEAIKLAALGRLAIRRASHVEPTSDGNWTADMAPVGGPIIGQFLSRSEALAAEVRWLETNWQPEIRPA